MPSLTVSIVEDSIAEDGTTTATVSREGTAGDLVVSLSSDKPDEATVPAQVDDPERRDNLCRFPDHGTARWGIIRPRRNGDDYGVV